RVLFRSILYPQQNCKTVIKITLCLLETADYPVNIAAVLSITGLFPFDTQQGYGTEGIVGNFVDPVAGAHLGHELGIFLVLPLQALKHKLAKLTGTDTH